MVLLTDNAYKCHVYCAHTWYILIAPALTVTVNNATSAIAGTRHTLTCSVMGANLETATVVYTWLLNDVVVQETSSSNQYNITSVQASNAGDVYTCQVAVSAPYWDVSGSFGGSGSGTLTVTSKYALYTFVIVTILSLSLQFLLPLYNSVDSHWCLLSMLD